MVEEMMLDTHLLLSLLSPTAGLPLTGGIAFFEMFFVMGSPSRRAAATNDRSD
jgi:hypothetical protein